MAIVCSKTKLSALLGVQDMSTEKPSNNPNPPFPKPDPAELQSPSSRDRVHETLAETQGKETNVIDDVDNSDGDSNFMDKSQPTAYGLSSPPPAD
jgi:hypothetical protein